MGEVESTLKGPSSVRDILQIMKIPLTGKNSQPEGLLQPGCLAPILQGSFPKVLLTENEIARRPSPKLPVKESFPSQQAAHPQNQLTHDEKHVVMFKSPKEQGQSNTKKLLTTSKDGNLMLCSAEDSDKSIDLQLAAEPNTVWESFKNFIGIFVHFISGSCKNLTREGRCQEIEKQLPCITKKIKNAIVSEVNKVNVEHFRNILTNNQPEFVRESIKTEITGQCFWLGYSEYRFHLDKLVRAIYEGMVEGMVDREYQEISVKEQKQYKNAINDRDDQLRRDALEKEKRIDMQLGQELARIDKLRQDLWKAAENLSAPAQFHSVVTNIKKQIDAVKQASSFLDGVESADVPSGKRTSRKSHLIKELDILKEEVERVKKSFSQARSILFVSNNQDTTVEMTEKEIVNQDTTVEMIEKEIVNQDTTVEMIKKEIVNQDTTVEMIEKEIVKATCGRDLFNYPDNGAFGLSYDHLQTLVSKLQNKLISIREQLSCSHWDFLQETIDNLNCDIKSTRAAYTIIRKMHCLLYSEGSIEACRVVLEQGGELVEGIARFAPSSPIEVFTASVKMDELRNTIYEQLKNLEVRLKQKIRVYEEREKFELNKQQMLLTVRAAIEAPRSTNAFDSKCLFEAISKLDHLKEILIVANEIEAEILPGYENSCNWNPDLVIENAKYQLLAIVLEFPIEASIDEEEAPLWIILKDLLNKNLFTEELILQLQGFVSQYAVELRSKACLQLFSRISEAIDRGDWEHLDYEIDTHLKLSPDEALKLKLSFAKDEKGRQPIRQRYYKRQIDTFLDQARRGAVLEKTITQTWQPEAWSNSEFLRRLIRLSNQAVGIRNEVQLPILTELVQVYEKISHSEFVNQEELTALLRFTLDLAAQHDRHSNENLGISFSQSEETIRTVDPCFHHADATKIFTYLFSILLPEIDPESIDTPETVSLLRAILGPGSDVHPEIKEINRQIGEEIACLSEKQGEAEAGKLRLKSRIDSALTNLAPALGCKTNADVEARLLPPAVQSILMDLSRVMHAAKEMRRPGIQFSDRKLYQQSVNEIAPKLRSLNLESLEVQKPGFFRRLMEAISKERLPQEIVESLKAAGAEKIADGFSDVWRDMVTYRALERASEEYIKHLAALLEAKNELLGATRACHRDIALRTALVYEWKASGETATTFQLTSTRSEAAINRLRNWQVFLEGQDTTEARLRLHMLSQSFNKETIESWLSEAIRDNANLIHQYQMLQRDIVALRHLVAASRNFAQLEGIHNAEKELVKMLKLLGRHELKTCLSEWYEITFRTIEGEALGSLETEVSEQREHEEQVDLREKGRMLVQNLSEHPEMLDTGIASLLELAVQFNLASGKYIDEFNLEKLCIETLQKLASFRRGRPRSKISRRVINF